MPDRISQIRDNASFPMWTVFALVVMLFAYFFYLMWGLSESQSASVDEDNMTNEDLEDVSFVVEDESPSPGNYEEIGYPAARYANGTILYSAMGTEDCPPSVENVEYLRGSTLLITPKQYDDSAECSGDIIAIVERISREDGEPIQRDNAQTIVVNANIPEDMVWQEQDDSHEDHQHRH